MISIQYKFSYPQLGDPSHLPHCAHEIQNQNLTNIELATKLGNIPYENFGVNHETYLKSEELPSKYAVLQSILIHFSI